MASGYRGGVLALFLVAASLGMSNLAASIAIGVSGVDARTRLRVGLVFGLFESGMPVLGLLIGEQAAASLGHAARWIGAGLLIAVGLYTLVSATRTGSTQAHAHGGPGSAGAKGTTEPIMGGTGSTGQPPQVRSPGLIRLLVSGLALSVDNLVVGFALGTYHTSIAVGVIVIGVVSVGMSLLGLELGVGIGRWAGRRGEQLAGLTLISVGIAIASGALS